MKRVTLFIAHGTVPLLEIPMPVKGAKVIVGEEAKRAFVTDESSKIQRDVPDDYAVVTSLVVKGDNFELGISNYVIEAGNNYVIEV
jgi:hypothetical protein